MATAVDTSRMRRPLELTGYTLTFIVAWCLLVLTVQPWTDTEGRSTSTDSGGILKGLVLVACMALLTLRLTPATRLRIPPFAAVYVAYGATFTIASLALGHPVDATMRAMRLMLAVLVPVLAWPLLQRRPDHAVHAHLVAYAGLTGLIVVGAIALPGRAWHDTTGTGGDRLMGAVLPMMPPRVGEIGAVLVGLAVVALLARRIPWWLGATLIGTGATILVLSRTRTAGLAMVAALVLAFLVSRRSRLGRRGIGAAALTGAAVVPALPLVLDWLTRSQSVEQIASLSGRTTVWQYIAEAPTTTAQLLWGRGLGEKRVVLRRGEGDINVMAIDNTWLGAYWEAGLVAVGFIVLAVALVLYQSMTAPTAYVRTSATFLVVFVLASSLSESGLSDVSSQTLSLLVAASAAYADHRRTRERSTTLEMRTA